MTFLHYSESIYVRILPIYLTFHTFNLQCSYSAVAMYAQVNLDNYINAKIKKRFEYHTNLLQDSSKIALRNDSCGDLIFILLIYSVYIFILKSTSS